MTKPTPGWLGTGRMGTAMAGRLLQAGHPVAVWKYRDADFLSLFAVEAASSGLDARPLER